MYFKDDFDKREKLKEDLWSVFGKLEANPDFAKCIFPAIDCGIPLNDVTNPKALDKALNNGFGFPCQINTYPFGNPTDIVYPSFLAVCNKKSDFRKILTEMVNHGIKQGNVVKEMVLITNCWDGKEFKAFEESFYSLFEQFGIRTSVVLVTEYSANIIF